MLTGFLTEGETLFVFAFISYKHIKLSDRKLTPPHTHTLTQYFPCKYKRASLVQVTLIQYFYVNFSLFFYSISTNTTYCC